MSGLGRIPATSYDSHFRRIVTLYATMLCNDDVVAENIVPINELMTSIGSDIGIDFLALLESEKRQCTPVIEHSFGIAAYTAATEAFFRQQLVQEFQEKVAQHQAQIEILRTKPDNYSGTLKQYRERTKKQVQALQNATAELRKRITRYRNNELENPEQTKLTTYIQEQYERSGGFLTDAQRAYRIDELTKLAFASQIYEFYPTPNDIITEMLLPAADIQPGMTVLEPSAGTGNIAHAIREQYPDASLHVIEYNDTLREILQLKHYNVVGTDTLAYTGQQYDRIVMNPPFDHGVDIVHVTHCYEKLLKNGGRLVAIMSKRAYTDKQAFDAVKFARFVDKVGKAVGISNKRYSQELERAITIDVILVELTKPLREEQRAETTFLTVQPGDRVKNILTQTSYIVESVADQIVLRNTATQSVEYATALPSNRFAIDTKGTTKKKLPARSAKQRDPEFQTVSVVTARRDLTAQPESNHIRPAIITDIVKPYVIDGANYAIESLERTGGFLLTDGTGTGKTIQQLFVADTMHYRYRRPVLIFTESDQIIQQSFFGDARKLGMSTPDAQEFKEKLAKKPKNYSGMYGLEGAADSTTVYRFDPKVGLRDGINIGTYNDISLMFPSDPLMDKMNKSKNYLPLIDKLSGMGYRTFVIYIRVPKEVSVERALGRYQRSGRFVPMEVIDEVYEAGEKAMRSILERVDGYVIVDGMTQEIVERGGIELPTDRDYRQITTDAETPKTSCCTGMADKEAARNPNIIYGSATTIETPGRSIPARYALTELQHIIVSHNPVNFSPDDRYPNGCQQRNYDRDPAEQLKVEQGAKNFDPRFSLAVTPTATDGPAIVNAENICLGGNGRTMMMKRVATDVLKEKYVSLLKELRCLFGFSMDDIATFQQPTLVRVVDMQPQECALFSNILNTSLTQKQDITSKTVSFARQLTPSLVAEIADLFETANRETVAQLWATPSVVFKVQKLLRAAGIVTDQNVSEWFSDAHTFTSEGRLLIEGTLLGTILPDKDFIEAARSYTDKLLRTLPSMIRMQRLPEKWNLMPDIQEIIILEAERRAANIPLDLFLQQTTFDREEVHVRTELLWRLLAASALAPWKEFVTRYVQTAETEVQHQESGGGFWEETLEPVEVIRRLKNDIGKNASGLRDKIDGMSSRIRTRIKEWLS